MHLVTIIWSLICAAVILIYPMYLMNKSSSLIQNVKKRSAFLGSNTVELVSFDLNNLSPSWSFSLDVPQITEETLYSNPILFYLESDSACMKLPLNNCSLGYTASAHKNVGKVYLTFKSLTDGVSNFHVPSWHLGKLKILIIKSRDKSTYGTQNLRSRKSNILKQLQKTGININDYEEVLEYFSNIATIDFKGHFSASNFKVSSKRSKPEIRQESPILSSAS